MYNSNLPLSPDNHPDNIIKTTQVVINPKTGILQPDQNVVSPVTPNLSISPIVQSVIKPVSRPSGLSDAQWLEMQEQGVTKVTEQQAQVVQALQNVQIDKAIAASEKAAAAYSGTDAVASASHAADLAAVIKSGVSSGAASEIASQIMRSADAAIVAASAANATQDDKTAAAVAQVIATQALADAAKVKQDEVKKVADEADQTAQALKAKADASLEHSDLVAANQAQNRLDIANNDLMDAQQLTDDAVHQAAMTKQQADSDAAAVAAALLNPKATPVVVDNRNIFDKLIDYIYNKLYA